MPMLLLSRLDLVVSCRMLNHAVSRLPGYAVVALPLIVGLPTIIKAGMRAAGMAINMLLPSLISPHVYNFLLHTGAATRSRRSAALPGISTPTPRA
jgi:hypothetical protein